MDQFIFPWNRPLWESLAVGAGQLPHALLLCGMQGLGKQELALAISQLLLCSDRAATTACGKCRNCQLFTTGNHPDFHVLASEAETVSTRLPLVSAYSDRYQDVKAREKRSKPAVVIAVDSIRQLIEKFSTTAHTANHKVALFCNAGSMNINAANALLKLLEEPPPQATLILVASTPQRLPLTIHSRCMTVHFRPPQRDIMLDWLRSKCDDDRVETALTLANDSPLEALGLLTGDNLSQRLELLEQIAQLASGQRDSIELAALLAKTDSYKTLLCIQRQVAQWIRQAACDQPLTVGKHQLGTVSTAARRLAFFKLHDRISFYRGHAGESINLQLAFEDILLGMATLLLTGKR